MRRPARSSRRCGRSRRPCTRCSPVARRSRCPGESNKSTDLIARINRAKPQPIGRSDVPAALEKALQRAMCRKPENRQGSVLELIHELQAVESELGVPQTQVEVAMDDWALATVADLEDRTRIRVAARRPARSRSAAAAGVGRRGRPTATAGRHPDARHERRPAQHGHPRHRAQAVPAARVDPRARGGRRDRARRDGDARAHPGCRRRHPGGDRCRGDGAGTTVSSPGRTRGSAAGDSYQIDDERRRAKHPAQPIVHRRRRTRRPGLHHRHGEPRGRTGSAERGEVRGRARPDDPGLAEAAPIARRHRDERHGGRGPHRRRSRSSRTATPRSASTSVTARSGWPTATSRRIGRANTEVLELNTVVPTTGNDLDVLQSGTTVLLFDRGESKLEIVDAATSAVTDTVPLPPDQPEVLPRRPARGHPRAGHGRGVVRRRSPTCRTSTPSRRRP